MLRPATAEYMKLLQNSFEFHIFDIPKTLAQEVMNAMHQLHEIGVQAHEIGKYSYHLGLFQT